MLKKFEEYLNDKYEYECLPFKLTIPTVTLANNSGSDVYKVEYIHIDPDKGWVTVQTEGNVTVDTGFSLPKRYGPLNQSILRQLDAQFRPIANYVQETYDRFISSEHDLRTRSSTLWYNNNQRTSTFPSAEYVVNQIRNKIKERIANLLHKAIEDEEYSLVVEVDNPSLGHISEYLIDEGYFVVLVETKESKSTIMLMWGDYDTDE